MKIGIANDHAGFDLKLVVAQHLRSKGHDVVDLGAHSADSTDYPIWGRKLGEAVAAGEVEYGIAICGSGVGISIAANKVPGVRAVCCSESYSAVLSRQHNDANVLAFGARVVGPGVALMIVDQWLATSFEGGRHANRVELLG